MKFIFRELRFLLLVAAVGVVVFAVLVDCGVIFGPREIENAELWRQSPTEDYCRVGPHKSYYKRGVKEFRKGSEAKVLSFYYPIVPKVARLTTNDPDPYAPQPAQEYADCIVWVKTKRFNWDSQAFRGDDKNRPLVGYVSGGSSTLPAHVLSVIRESQPGHSGKKIVVFTEGPPWGSWPLWPFAVFVGLAFGFAAASLPTGKGEPSDGEGDQDAEISYGPIRELPPMRPID